MNDLISRQAAIDMIMGQPAEPHYPTWYAEQIKTLPSAQSERKTGRWYDVGSLSCRCSECGCKSQKEFSFCPNCGARMNGKGGSMDDMISRAAAIDDLHGKDPSQIWDTADVEVWVNDLPSAQPERKMGRWKTFDHTYGRSVFVCTGCETATNVPTLSGKPIYKFCPYCGTEMIKGETDD